MKDLITENNFKLLVTREMRRAAKAFKNGRNFQITNLLYGFAVMFNATYRIAPIKVNI